LQGLGRLLVPVFTVNAFFFLAYRRDSKRCGSPLVAISLWQERMRWHSVEPDRGKENKNMGVGKWEAISLLHILLVHDFHNL
jgi:hypothetical protein